ncbi:MAG: diguanylate cyclase [Treponema sp.]|nr:diguanylate cyclase [Treponema sp.]
MKPPKSVKTRIVAMLATVIIATTVLITIVRVVEIHNGNMATLAERLESNVIMTDLVFTKFFSNAWSKLDILYTLPQVQAAVRGQGNIEELSAVLWALFEGITPLGQITIGGNVINYGVFASLLVFDSEFDLIYSATNFMIAPGFNARNTPFTENIRQAPLGNSWLSNVVYSPVSGLMQVWITRPIMDGNNFLGMVAIPVHTGGLGHYLESIAYQTGRYFTVIADPFGLVAYSNRPDYTNMNVVALGIAPSLAMLPQDQMFEYTSALTGNREMAHLHIAPENAWMVMGGVDRASRLATAGQIILGVLPFVVGLLAAGVVLFMFIMQVLNPLGLLADSLKDIASGDADMSKRLEEKGGAEIAAASRYFNQVMEKFGKLVASIEGQAEVLAKKEEAVQERMRAILDSSPMVCALYNEKGDIMDVNKEVENMFGISDKRVYITDHGRFMPKSQPDGSESTRKSRELLAKAFKEGSNRFEWTYMRGDGTPFPAEEIVQRIIIADKPHIIAYTRDLSDQYRERERDRSIQSKLQAMMQQFNEHVQAQSVSVAASSAATEEMIANIRSVTDTLSHNAKNVNDLQDASAAGQSSLNEVVSDIQEIARESESLLEINAVMENIAGQTNLLSMNAAIEAARAGESGKGFAVVAGEIRKLAESSSQQSQTINGVLQSIKSSIDKITMSTDAVIGKFGAIGDVVKTVAVQENNILNAMEEQGRGSQQILQAVSEVNDVTHQVKEAARRMVEINKEGLHKTNDTETRTFNDDLTGVRNKKYFLEAAEQELRYCTEENRDFNLIIFGVDNVKHLADTHGDAIRDEVLKVLMLRARNSFKQGTLMARYSNEEFVITLPNVGHKTAMKLAEQIQKKVKEAPFTTKGLKLDVSISLGIASKTSTAKTLQGIISNAEKALFDAKTTGRNKMLLSS